MAVDPRTRCILDKNMRVMTYFFDDDFKIDEAQKVITKALEMMAGIRPSLVDREIFVQMRAVGD